MKRKIASRVVFSLVAVLAATGACGSAFEAERALNGNKETKQQVDDRARGPTKLTREMMSIADVSERAIPSVVNISTKKKVKAGPNPFSSPFFSDPFFRRFFGQRTPEFRQRPQERLERSLGSGVIVGNEGLVLTNNHVVEDADEVIVTLHDKREFKAELLGKDPPSDLAVLKLQEPPEDLKTIPLGDSDVLRLGEVVVAIGNPFGVGQTVTMGIVSAKGRANVGIVDYEDFIQTDAAINPGNSGGALLNLRGELIGINTAILSRTGGNQGIGFAIPSNMASAIMASLIEDGKVVRGFLGVMIQDLTSELAKAMDSEVKEGVLVSDVIEDSPADRAGVETGDIVVKVDGQEVATAGKLRNLIAVAGAGRTVELEVIRDGDRKTIEVELTEKSGDDQPVEVEEDDEGPLAGIQLEPLTDELRRKLGVDRAIESGAVVTAVQQRSPAAEAGLRPGDVIIGVNRRGVEGPSDFMEAYEAAGETVLLRVHRRGSSLFLVLKK